MLESVGLADAGRAIRGHVHAWFQERKIGFFAVADGMPAENKDEETAAWASATALRAIHGALSEQAEWLTSLGAVLEPGEREELRRQLEMDRRG